MLDEIDLHQLNATSRSCEGVLDVRRFDWPADLPDWAKPTDLGLPELVCYGLPPEVVFLGPGQRPMGLQHDINTVVSQALPKLHEAAEVAYTVIVGLLLMLLGLIVVLAVVCYHMDRRARESARLRQLPGRRKRPAPRRPAAERRASLLPHSASFSSAAHPASPSCGRARIAVAPPSSTRSSSWAPRAPSPSHGSVCSTCAASSSSSSSSSPPSPTSSRRPASRLCRRSPAARATPPTRRSRGPRVPPPLTYSPPRRGLLTFPHGSEPRVRGLPPAPAPSVCVSRQEELQAVGEDMGLVETNTAWNATRVPLFPPSSPPVGAGQWSVPGGWRPYGT